MTDDRPTLHITNWSSPKLHGPGRKYTIMARPRDWEVGDGTVILLAPDVSSLKKLKSGALAIEAYRDKFLAYLSDLGPRLRPGELMATCYDRRFPVGDGDTLCCACSRDVAARGECHRAWVAAALAGLGWQVILDGREIAWKLEKS